MGSCQNVENLPVSSVPLVTVDMHLLILGYWLLQKDDEFLSNDATSYG